MSMLRDILAAVVLVTFGLAPLASASAHGSYHGGHGGYEHHGWGHYGYVGYGFEYHPAYGCRVGYHFGQDGQCWRDER